MVSRKPVLIFIVLAMTTVFSQAADTQQPAKINVIEKLKLPKQALDMIVQRLGRLPLKITVKDSKGSPAAKVALNFTWPGGTSKLTTDESGAIAFDLKKEHTAELTLLVPSGYTANVTSNVTTISGPMSADSPAASTKEGAGASLDTMDRIENSGLEIYFPIGKEYVGRNALAFLDNVRGYIIGFAALDLKTPLGLVLSERETGGCSVQATPTPTITVNIQDMDLKYLKEGVLTPLTIPREWIKLSLAADFPGDGRVQFFRDGLAELLAYDYTRHFFPSIAKQRLIQHYQRLKKLLAEGHLEYDLNATPVLQAPPAKSPVQLAGAGNKVESKVIRTSSPAGQMEKQVVIISGPAGPPSGPGQPSGAETAATAPPPVAEPPGSAVAFWFFWNIQSKNGPDAVRKLAEWFQENKSSKYDEVAQKIEAVTGSRPTFPMNVQPIVDDLQKLSADR